MGINERSLRSYYFAWLENELTSEGDHPDRSYSDLVAVMFDTEFGWSIPMDDNRLADGMELRSEFAVNNGFDRDDLAALGPPSFIEVLIGLSRRLSFVGGGSAKRWAWQLLINLELNRMWDRMSRSKMERSHRIFMRVIERTYEPNGVGGFFPLAWPEQDQRQVELWYQLNAYAEEQHAEH